MHELILSSVWNWLNMSTILNLPEQAMGSEYALIYMNMSNLPKYTRMWENMPHFV